jgi:hypothetical protein
MATSCEWRSAELLDRLQNGTHRGKAGTADQSVHGRMGLGTACKEETSRIKNVLIQSSGGKKLCLLVEENCVFTEKFLHAHTHTHKRKCVSYPRKYMLTLDMSLERTTQLARVITAG